ncbi:MAG: NADH-quinone oxidoreductase subunit A, partial [bacterium]
VCITGAFAVMTIMLAEKFGPKKYIPAKYAPYECGITPQEPVLQRMDIQFYRTSILFLIFGVELIFFYPWAVWASRMGWMGIIDMAIFFAILLVGFLLAWTKGALEWRQVPLKPRS